MKNKLFQKIGYWSALGAAALSLINCIVYLIMGIVKLNSQHKDNYDLVSYFLDGSYGSVIFKICLGVFALSALAFMISFFINAKPVLKIIMAIFKVTQAACVPAAIVFQFLSGVAYIFVVIFFVLELAVLALYIIDRDHRKTILRVILFFVIMVSCPLIFVLIALLLIFAVVNLIMGLFQEPEHEDKFGLYDKEGNLLGWVTWLKRYD